MKTWADAIIAKVCNEHRNSDLRADNLMVIKALNEAHAAEREACAKIARDGAEECMANTCASCCHSECVEQRAMAKACRDAEAAIRARGKA